MKTELVRSRPGGFDILPAHDAAATCIEEGIYVSPGLSNTYLVVTRDGRVVINTGMGFEASVHRRNFDAVAASPIRAVILTQGHTDHVGGVHAFMEEGTELIAQENNLACQADDARIHALRVRRSAVFWGEAVKRASAHHASLSQGQGAVSQSRPVPTLTFRDRHELMVGDTRFVLLATPGGETTDSLVIHLPERGVVFAGNVFSALFGHFPNLVTVRGDRLRFALPFVDSVNKVLALEPELLLTGHFGPIRGRELIRAELTRLRDAVAWVHDATVAGMNAGKDVYTLMREVRLPPELEVGEGYGKVSWSVRAIVEGYAGWFHHRSTTELYGVPHDAISADLVALAGADSLVSRADTRLQEGSPEAALHLVEHVLRVEPEHQAALALVVAIHAFMLERSGGENFWEVGWLRRQMSLAERRLAKLAGGAS